MEIIEKKLEDIDINEKKLIFDINKDKSKTFKPIKGLNKLKPFEFWDYIGSPKYICAPMVDQSEQSFRLLCRRYCTTLAYTPMVHSVVFTNCEKYRNQWLNDINCKIESPTFFQFCGNDPEILLKAAKYVEGKCEAIDLNLGCPQGIAKRGNYGSFLLENTERVVQIIGYLSNNIVDTAITCKIRLFPDLEKTFNLVKDLEKAGAKVITIHGRTKEEKGQKVRECNWEAIKKIKELSNIPIIANGGIESFNDVEKCLEYTKCDGVMSSEALLEYPALFYKEKILNIDDLTLEYLEISKELNNDPDYVRSHLFKFFYQALQNEPELNQKLASCKTYDDFNKFTIDVKDKRKDIPNEEKLGWYRRYRHETKNSIKVQNRGTDIFDENKLMDLNEEVMDDICSMFNMQS